MGKLNIEYFCQNASVMLLSVAAEQLEGAYPTTVSHINKREGGVNNFFNQFFNSITPTVDMVLPSVSWQDTPFWE